MKKALYVGSFDPMTNGHLDIIKRASKLYDEVVVGIAVNISKKGLLSFEERKMLIAETVADMKNVKVEMFNGLLATYVNENNFDVVIRGLRATTDFEYEIQMAQMNATLYEKDVETIFLMTAPEYSFISSSLIKEVFLHGGKIHGMVPKNILAYMEEKKGAWR